MTTQRPTLTERIALSRARADTKAGFWLFNEEASVLLDEVDRLHRVAADTLDLLRANEVSDAIVLLEEIDRIRGSHTAQQTLVPLLGASS